MTLRLRGTFIDIICEMNPEYENYVMAENGEKVL